MSSTRSTPLILLSAAVLGGTLYSVVYHTYLDTSDPLLSHLPHPLHHQSIFAQKSNIFNSLFVKKAWGWTSAAFAAVWLSSPSNIRTRDAWGKWGIATMVWGIFAAWFFGPGVLERLAVASGGECVLQLPPEVPGQSPTLLSVPVEYCFTKSTISPRTHPTLFVTSLSSTLDATWAGNPRLYRGHDVSGHIFLLTLAVLFLHDQLEPAWRLINSTAPTTMWYKATVAVASALLGLWFIMSFATSIYWHTPFEKLTGFALGLLGFAMTQLPFCFQNSESDSLSTDTSRTRKD
ncbi:hypothetical protein K439DRAFT_1644485 [Ramaria rubella]|nr:hypothetical protein K439DRAFT_1644485 [Ramaria rubella]